MSTGRAVLPVKHTKRTRAGRLWSALQAALWLALMLVWLGGLAFGVWWVWPHFERLELTTDLVGSLIWLSAGAVAWLVALRFGVKRYWNR